MKKVMSTFMVALVSGLTMLAADSPKYGLLKGRILDNEKNPLAGAVVVIDSDKLSAVTDLDGFFSFANLSSGNHSLKVTYIGFLPVSKTITVSEESTIDDIVMSDTSRELNEVVVTGVFLRAAKSDKCTEKQRQHHECGICRPDRQVSGLEYRRRAETYKRHKRAV